MRTKHTTEINVYHTPDKASRPDLKHQSHLKTTVPSVYQTSTQAKQTNQFGTHHQKMRNYDDLGDSPHIYSEKRPSKNQWELKQKVDEYETQIGLLKEYLRSCHCNCIQKKSISRIFGFPEGRDGLANQQQRVIKQLGSKVRGLVKQNISLKHQNAHYNQLNIDQIIEQNEKLRLLLEDYKVSDDVNHKRLFQQNELLKDEIYHLKLDYEEKLKLMEIENENRLSYLRANQSELLAKIQLLQLQNKQNLRQTLKDGEKLSAVKLTQIEQNHTKQLIDQENFWKKQLQEQEQYYLKAKSEIEQSNKQYYTRLQNQQLIRLKQYYTNAIQDIEVEQKRQYERLLRIIDELEKRLEDTNKSISHLKFERENRMQTTVRKSLNVAFSSTKPQGQVAADQPVIDQTEENVKINTRPLSYSVSPKMSSLQADILNQKISYLERQINELKIKLHLSQRLVGEKTQKIIILQNEIRNLNDIVASLNYNLSQVKNQILIKEVIKEVPVPVIPNDYSEEVKNIKESIVSCNLGNFDIFQTQFHEIIDQRNQLNQKMIALKKEAKESSKILILQKHLKIQRQRNKQLEQNLKKYEQQIQNLKIQVIELQNQIQTIHTKHESNESAAYVSRISLEHLPDGKAGLQWQKVVKHCLMTSINRLQNLQIRMKQDMAHNK